MLAALNVTQIRGDYQQYDLGPDGAVTWCGERMDAKLAALASTGLAPDFVAGHSVLDIGTDCGFWAFMASTAGARSVLGLDRNRDVKAKGFVDLVALNTATARRFPRHDRVHFRAVNLGRQWHEFGLFEVAFCQSVYHHIYAQCGDHDSVWFWLARHVAPGGILIWEGPTDDSDPVIRANMPQVLQAGYNREVIRKAASAFFGTEVSRPALHEPTREVWLCRRSDAPTGRVVDRYQMRDGAGGAAHAFRRDDGRRMDEIEAALGARPMPGSLNVVVPEDFDWGCEYYRVQILDSTDRGNPRAPWAPRWCRFYPVAVGGVGGWAMRFEGEQYALNFVEAIGPHRFRDLLNDGGAIGAGGFRWPASGAGPAQVALREVRMLDEVLRHVPGRRTVIQAGGNVGVYPAYLAEYFSQVITFEPDAANFECLDRNVAAPNVRKHHAALGGVPGTAGLVRAPLNAGAHYMEGAGAVRVVTVDSLGVADCDFMCLDVEGAEFAVLKGAEATIARCRPVIMFEDKGMSERYGIAQGAVERWLAQVFGYRLIGRTPHDALMVSA